MTPAISFPKTPGKASDMIVLALYGEEKKPVFPDYIGKKTRDFIGHGLKSAGHFKAGAGETLALTLPAGAEFGRAVLLGLGKAAQMNPVQAETAGGKLCAALKALQPAQAAVFIPESKKLKKTGAAEIAAHLAAGFSLRAYAFDRYKSPPKEKKTALKKLEITGAAGVEKLYKALVPALEGTLFARDLVNEPPNRLYPESYAQKIKDELGPLGVDIDVLDEKKMEKLGMGGILAVGMGSVHKPRMVVMRWKGAGRKAGKGKDKGPLAFVGKGITFDTGGISLKPGADMDEMKMDMGGSAAVVGLMKTLALRQSPADVVGIVALAENMPSADAYRPGDILSAYSGKTIEVLNTDAEGRLVLADALGYVQDKYAPALVIDLATLTGAVMVALGYEYCGAFANDDKLWARIEKAGKDSGEKIWRLPLDEVWSRDVESDIADVRNLAKGGRWAGACTAAAFLEHFIEKGTPWAHLDIAGTAWSKSDRPTVPKFATGYGVRLLARLVADHYEQA